MQRRETRQGGNLVHMAPKVLGQRTHATTTPTIARTASVQISSNDRTSAAITRAEMAVQKNRLRCVDVTIAGVTALSVCSDTWSLTEATRLLNSSGGNAMFAMPCSVSSWSVLNVCSHSGASWMSGIVPSFRFKLAIGWKPRACRTNSQVTSRWLAVELGQWVGMDVRAENEGFFYGSDIELIAPDRTDADQRILVVRDKTGGIATRENIAASGTDFSWDGNFANGVEAPDGAYIFRVESFNNGTLLATESD